MGRSTERATKLSVWLTATFLLSACASSSTDTAAPSSSATTTTAAATTAPSTTQRPVATVGTLPHELDATFVVVLDSTDVSRGDQAGTWFLTLTRSNGYVFGRGPSDSRANTGVLTVSDGAVTFSAERGEGACEGDGAYRWKAAADTVSFTVTEDPCTARVNQTTAEPYRRCSDGPTTCVAPH